MEIPARHRGRRAFAGAGVLLALATALLAGGTAHAAPAAVDRTTERSGADTGPRPPNPATGHV
ncbi:hypothetical protein ACFQ51_02355 [Streptomyces kaempferi]